MVVTMRAKMAMSGDDRAVSGRADDERAMSGDERAMGERGASRARAWTRVDARTPHSGARTMATRLFV